MIASFSNELPNALRVHALTRIDEGIDKLALKDDLMFTDVSPEQRGLLLSQQTSDAIRHFLGDATLECFSDSYQDRKYDATWNTLQTKKQLTVEEVLRATFLLVSSKS